MKDIYVATIIVPISSIPKIVGAYSSRESAQKAIDEIKRIDREDIGDYADLYIYKVTRIPLVEEEES